MDTLISLIVGGLAILAIYLMLQKPHKKSALRDIPLDQPDTELSREAIREKAQPLLDKYYIDAVAFHLSRLARERQVEMKVRQKIEDESGMTEPPPFADWEPLFGYGKEYAVCQNLAAEVDQKAQKDALAKLEKMISDEK